MDVRRIIVGRPLRIFVGLSLDVRWMLLGSTLTFRRPLDVREVFDRLVSEVHWNFVGCSLGCRADLHRFRSPSVRLKRAWKSGIKFFATGWARQGSEACEPLRCRRHGFLI